MQFILYCRHGSRYPGFKAIGKMHSHLPRIKRDILQSKLVKGNFSLFTSYKILHFLKNVIPIVQEFHIHFFSFMFLEKIKDPFRYWHIQFNESHHHLLSKTGEHELYEIGEVILYIIFYGKSLMSGMYCCVIRWPISSISLRIWTESPRGRKS